MRSVCGAMAESPGGAVKTPENAELRRLTEAFWPFFLYIFDSALVCPVSGQVKHVLLFMTKMH